MSIEMIRTKLDVKVNAYKKDFRFMDSQKRYKLACQIERLENVIAADLDHRKRALTNHGVEWVEQDGHIYALGTYHTVSGWWIWEDVTTCNISHWLGY